MTSRLTGAHQEVIAATKAVAARDPRAAQQVCTAALAELVTAQAVNP